MTGRLLLIRHGETASNVEGRTQGRRDVPLTARGRAQAQAVAEALAAYAPAALYCSPASRARDTAAAIGARLGLPPHVDDRLAELDQGVLDGLTGEALRHEHADFLRRWRDDDPADLRMPGGETMREAQLRMIAAATDAVCAHPGVDVIAVSHNLSLHAFLCHAFGAPLAAFRTFRVELASLTVVEAHIKAPVAVDNGAPPTLGWAVVTLNDVCHIPADLPMEPSPPARGA